MKKVLILFISVSLIFSLSLLIHADKSHASDNLVDVKMLDKGQVKITIINDQTGETKVLNSKDIENNVEVNSIRSNEESMTVGYDIFIPVEDLNPKGITPLDTTGGSKTSGGITARLYVNYDVSSNNERIRLNRVYGSWTPKSSLYYLTNRVVNAHSGAIYGKKLTKYPTSNSFSYTTGWGYNYRALGSASPMAWSSAKAHVHGMTLTHTIIVEFSYS
ncbi:MAG: hypothetical protein GX320_06575 [Tissierellia bacterium]|nr:hypothetical protein [Tissierellia bacterium]